MIKITIPGKPHGNERAADGKYGKYLPAKSREYQDRIAWILRKAIGRSPVPSSKPFAFTILAFYPVPQSWPVWKKQGALDGHIVPTVKPDVDNIEKAVYDALNEVAYKDDAQIVNVNGFVKRYAKEPRLEITIETLDKLPANCSKADFDAYCRKISHVDTLI